MKRYSTYFIILICGILIGFFFERFSKVTFDDKINPIALAGLLLTIVIALYLEFVVRPSLSNSRNEKDIIIDELKEIRKICTNIQSCYNRVQSHAPISQEEKSELLQIFRTLSNQIEVLRDVVKYSKIKSIEENCKNLFSAYLKYKKSFTGFGFDRKDFYYDRVNYSKHEVSYKSFDKETMHFIFDVNKL